MAPGGSVCKDVIESHPKTLKYETATTKTDKTITRTATGANGKHGMQSTNGVHELLECPVCTTLTYPPIHQKENKDSYVYGGWWPVWWTGTYSMILSKASFFHRKSLRLYTNEMPASLKDAIGTNHREGC